MPTYAGFLRRFVAHLIDGVIVGVALTFLFSIFAFPLGFTSELLDENGSVSPFFGVFLSSWGLFEILACWLYYAGFESSAKQATLGKMAMGIRVTNLEGGRITFARATGRFFAEILSGLIVIGYLFPLFTRRKQALHDLIAETLVVKEGEQPAARGNAPQA